MGDPLAHIADPTLERLSAFLEGDLDPADRADVERELSAAPELRDALDAMRRSQGLVRRHGGARAPDGFADRVLEAVEREPVPISRARGWRRPLGLPVEIWALAAAAVLVVGVGLRARTMTFGGSPELRDDVPSPGAAAPVQKDEPEKKAGPSPEAPKTKAVQSMAPSAPQGTLNTGGYDGNTANTADPDLSLGTAGTATDPTRDAQLPEQSGTAMVGEAKGWNYEIQATDPDYVAQLNRVAAKYGAKLSPTTTSDGTDAWWIEVPGDQIMNFDKDLRKIGQVDGTVEVNRLQTKDDVKVYLRIEPVKAPEPRRATTEQK